MTSYDDDDDDDSQYDIYAINSHSTYDPYYDGYYDVYTTQASTPADSAQDTMQSSPTREPPKPTLPPSSYKSLSDDDIKAIAKRAVDDAFHRFSLLPHEPRPEPPAEPPRQPILTTSNQPLHTDIDLVESSTNHVIESSAKEVVESSAVIRNVVTTPPILIRIPTVSTSLTQAKSAPNPAATTRHAPHTRTARFVFDPGGKHCDFVTLHRIHHTNRRPRYRRPQTQPPYQYGRDTYRPYNQPAHEPYRRSYQALAAIQNGPVNKPRAYNAAEDVADDADEAYEAYYYDPPNDAYKSVAKCPRCRFHFDTYDKLVEHMAREGHEA